MSVISAKKGGGLLRRLIALCATGLLGGCAAILEEQQYMEGRALSPDGETLAFHYYIANPRRPGYGNWGPSLPRMLLGLRRGHAQVNETHYALGFYNIPKNEFSVIYPPPGVDYVRPSFSSDGKRVLFMIAEESGRSFAMLDLDTMRYRIIRRGDGWVSNPRLSPDDRKVLFTVKEIHRGGHNLREMDIESGQERWIVRYNFFETWGEYYGADSRQILFTVWDVRLKRQGHTGIIYKTIQAHRGSNLFLIDTHAPLPSESELKPHISDDLLKEISSGVSDWSGRILFTAITNDLDRQTDGEAPIMPGNPRAYFNYDLFIWDQGEITRLTKWADAIVRPTWSAVDGGRIVFASKPRRDGRKIYWMMDGDGKNARQIKFPENPDGWRVLTMQEEK